MATDIELTPELEAKLSRMAAAAGKDVATLAREILLRKIHMPDSEELPSSQVRGKAAGGVMREL